MKIIGFILLLCLHATAIYSQVGQLDPTFGTNGIVTAENRTTENNPTTGNTILSLPDGDMLVMGFAHVGGLFFLKIHPDGSRDLRYGLNGFKSIKGFQYGFATRAMLQPGGKILIVGALSSNYATAFELARLNIDGTIDSSFGKDGTQSTDFGTEKQVITSMAMGNDGKIVVAGYIGGVYPPQTGVLARYNANGSLDTSFSSDGKLTIGFSTFIPNSLAIQDDGKIVAVGQSIIARFNSDGSLDRSFSKNGRGIDDFGPGLNYYGVAIQHDGKVLVAGSLNSSAFATVRFTSKGKPDTSFSGDGKQIDDLNHPNPYHAAAASGITIKSDGKIIISGNYNFGDEQYYTDYFTLIGYNADGSTDSSFATTGKLGGSGRLNGAIIKPGGKMLVMATSRGSGCGRSNPDCSNYFYLKAYLDGSADPSFQSVPGQFPIGNSIYDRIVIQKDGKILVIDRVVQLIARYNTNGTLDSTFALNGICYLNLTPAALAIRADGKIVVAGDRTTGNKSKITIARFNADGSVDSTLKLVGSSEVYFQNQSASSVAVDNDRKILVLGNSFSILRFNADGSLDSSFSHDGKQLTDFSATQVSSAITIQPDGRIIVAGYVLNGSNFDLAIARYNIDGSLDKSFSQDGKQTFDFGGNELGAALALQPDGKIIISCTKNVVDTLGNQINKNVTARLNTDGSADTSFSGDGKQITDYHFDGSALALQSNGKIVVGGQSPTDMIFTKYNTDGSPDSTFGDNGKVLAQSGLGFTTVFSIAIFQDKLYTAGGVYNTSSTGVLARLLLNKNSIFPVIHITNPGRDTSYIVQSPIILSAAATDVDGTIQSVEFYNDGKLLFSKTDAPYTILWDSVPTGSYHITAVATDNDGVKTISAPVHITVLHNRPPVVAITSPVDGVTFVAPATILLNAEAIAHGGKIKTLRYYNGSALIHTEENPPYLWHWKDVAAGTYNITARATDSYGRTTISSLVIFTVSLTEASLASGSRSFKHIKTNIDAAVSLQVAPNPVRNTLTLYTTGLQENKRSTISIISRSGVMFQAKQLNNPIVAGLSSYRMISTIQLNVSTLGAGLYTIKLTSGDTIMYRNFVKL